MRWSYDCVKDRVTVLRSTFSAPQLIFFSLLLIAVVLTSHHVGGDNDASRMATVEALVEHGTWAIDDIPYQGPDQVFWRGHYYSTKPPVLSIIAAGVYWLLHTFFHLNLDATVPGPQAAYYFITVLLVGVSYAVVGTLLYCTLRLLAVSLFPRLFLTGCLVFGTLLFPYMSTFNNHVVAGALLSCGWYFWIQSRINLAYQNREIFCAGVFLSTTGVVEFSIGGLPLVFLGAVLLFRKQWQPLVFYIIGALIPLAVHFILTSQLTGDILPFYLRSEAYFSLESYWRNPRGIDALQMPLTLYAFNLLIGSHGVFLYTPLFMSAAWAWFHAWRTLRFWRVELACVLFCFIGLTIFLLIQSNNFGGDNFGVRWYVGFAPLFLFPLGIVAGTALSRRALSWIFVSATCSAAIALLGLVNPWSNQTIVRNDGRVIYFPLVGNAREIINTIKR